VLKLDGVVAAYDDVICLDGVSLEVRRGEIVTLIGANGAGKSTTLKTVSGLLTPRAGTIEFDGRTIVGRSPDAIVALGLVQVLEGRRVFPELSVEENLRVGAYLVDKRAKVRAMLADVYGRFPRLAERRRQFAGTLSGGEQQMLAFGRAMMARPKLLILDEPSGLGSAHGGRGDALNSRFSRFRRDHLPCRAKCQPGVAACGPCLRHGDRQDHHERQRSGASGR
jgi:branched-chain amino acid transport system ATP-binding protein